MQLRIRHLKRGILLFVFVLAGFASGCATTDSDTLSDRPWNSPKGWEHGLPQSMLEGR